MLSKILLAAVIFLQTAPTRQSTTGVVTGIMRTSTGEPLRGVRVGVMPVGNVGDDTLLESLALTDGDGRYRLEDVTPGRYYIVSGPVRSPLYHPGVTETERATTIVVAVGQVTV